MLSHHAGFAMCCGRRRPCEGSCDCLPIGCHSLGEEMYDRCGVQVSEALMPERENLL